MIQEFSFRRAGDPLKVVTFSPPRRETNDAPHLTFIAFCPLFASLLIHDLLTDAKQSASVRSIAFVAVSNSDVDSLVIILDLPVGLRSFPALQGVNFAWG